MTEHIDKPMPSALQKSDEDIQGRPVGMFRPTPVASWDDIIARQIEFEKKQDAAHAARLKGELND